MTTEEYPVAVVVAAILVIMGWVFFAHAHHSRSRYPPGPRPLPIIGNIFQFPASRWWIKFTKLGKQYGPLVHLSVANKHIVLISSQEMAMELLERTSTADRPHLLMVGELMGFDASIAFIGYGERWRTYRRISNKVMSASSVKMYSETLAKEALRLVSSLMDNPNTYSEDIRFSLGRTIMEAIYGIDCLSPDDTYIKVAEETLENISHAVIPGSYMVDIIPWLKYLPYMGLPFQRHVRLGRKQLKLMVGRPFQHVLRTRSEGTARPSFTSSILDGEIGLVDSSEKEDIISWAAGTMYGAAGETTHATLLNFVLAMVNNPSVQKRAQDELDSVVGQLRPPSFSDRSHLPFVNALVKEVTRWRVALPLGVAHVCREDIEYKDYYFPKGTILLSNVWSISQDPSYYKDPELFNPSRFLKEDAELDPFNFAFGYGPRICLGRYFAMDQLYIVVASLLWAFNISPLNEGVVPDPSYTSGFISTPSSFQCKFTPRHEGVEHLRHQF